MRGRKQLRRKETMKGERKKERETEEGERRSGKKGCTERWDGERDGVQRPKKHSPNSLSVRFIRWAVSRCIARRTEHAFLHALVLVRTPLSPRLPTLPQNTH